MVFTFLNKRFGGEADKPAVKATNIAVQNAQPTNKNTNQDLALSPIRRDPNIQFLSPGAMKSDFFSQSALDFISATNGFGTPYTDNQLLNAYMSSVYVYAAVHRVANLISRVKIIAKVKKDDEYVRVPDVTLINRIMQRDGGNMLSQMWLNYAIYGQAVVYKVKTRRAVLAEEEGQPIFDYKDGAVGGLEVIDKPKWSIYEEGTTQELVGLDVYQYQSRDGVLKTRTRLDRKEFVFVTDWNPLDKNRGKSKVAVVIHEAVSNSAIAQWTADYFTRGAMPFIMVNLEDDPALITDADLRKYKRQFEEYWQGSDSSLRAVMFDRKVTVEQVGISASEVTAPELNESALEGIAAAFGLDRELIVTPSGGSQERHEHLIMRAWNDSIIPLANKFLAALQSDLGLDEDMILELDLSGITELEADRADKSSTEMEIFNGGLQSYNETRTRLKMSPIEKLDGFFQQEGKWVTVDQMAATKAIPNPQVVDYALQLWDNNLAKRNQILAMLGREPDDRSPDGYRAEVEGRIDLIQSLWADDLLTRKQVLGELGIEAPRAVEDGYRSELERGADYGEFIVRLWADNLLTRSQTIKLLDMGIEFKDESADGYQDEIGNRSSAVMDLWNANLITRNQTLDRLQIEPVAETVTGPYYDAYQDELAEELRSRMELKDKHSTDIRDWWSDNLITRRQAMEGLGIPVPAAMIDGFQDEVNQAVQKIAAHDDTVVDRTMEQWRENLIEKSEAAKRLGLPFKPDNIDGYKDKTDTIGGEYYGALGDQIAKEFKQRVDEQEAAAAALEQQKLTEAGAEVEATEPENQFKSIMPIVDESDLEIYSCIWVGNNSEISALAGHLKSLIPTPGIEWTHPSMYHVTVTYGTLSHPVIDQNTGDAGETAMLTMLNMPDEIVFNAPLKVQRLDVFHSKWDSQYYLVGLVDKDENLKSINQISNQAVQGADPTVKLSDYSTADAYTPHITLAISASPINIPSVTLAEIELKPDTFYWGGDNYEMFGNTPIVYNETGDGGNTPPYIPEPETEAPIEIVVAPAAPVLSALEQAEAKAEWDAITANNVASKLNAQRIGRPLEDAVLPEAVQSIVEGNNAYVTELAEKVIRARLADHLVVDGGANKMLTSPSTEKSVNGAVQESWNKELKAWRTAALKNKKKGVKFEAIHMNGDASAILSEIITAIPSDDEYKSRIASLFDAVVKIIGKG